MDAGGTSPGMDEVERSRMPEPRAMHGAIAEAGQIHQEWIWTTNGRPEGQDAGMYPAIRSEMVCHCLWLDPRLRGDDDGEIADTVRSYSTHLFNKPGG